MVGFGQCRLLVIPGDVFFSIAFWNCSSGGQGFGPNVRIRDITALAAEASGPKGLLYANLIVRLEGRTS
jgi:hypothetical protein